MLMMSDCQNVEEESSTLNRFGRLCWSTSRFPRVKKAGLLTTVIASLKNQGKSGEKDSILFLLNTFTVN